MNPAFRLSRSFAACLFYRSMAAILAAALLTTVSACSMLAPEQTGPASAKVAVVPTDSVRRQPATVTSASSTSTVDAALLSAAKSDKRLVPPVAGVQPPIPSPVLKCWQDGRLIVETRIQELPAHAASVYAMRDGNSGAAIYAFDLQRAFCLAQ
jgi:hypothetical protein